MFLTIFLGVLGPWQLIAILILLGLIAGIVVLVVKLTSNKSTPPIQQQPVEDPLVKLDKLNKLRESGALTEVEFEIEKRKILQ